MATYTDFGNLELPARSESYSIEVLNRNFMAIAEMLKNRPEVVAGKGFSTNDFTDTLKKKLENLSNYDDSTIKKIIAELEEELNTNIEEIEAKDTTLETNITQNTQLIKELQEENSLLKSQIPTANISDESITVNDSSNLSVERFGVGGNSKQETREGYNVLNLEKYAYDETQSVLNGGTITIEDGVLTIDATNATAFMTAKSKSYSRTNGNADVIPAGTYYFGIRTNGAYVSDTSTLVQFQEGVVTLTEDYILTQWYASCAVGNIVSRPLLLSKNSFKTEYEQYGAMPSIGFPSPIQSVESANIVVCNKNYLDSSIFVDIDKNGVNIKRNTDGTITLNGTYTGSSTWNYSFKMTNILPKEIAKNCIISMQKISGNVTGELRYMLWDSEGGNRWVSFENTNYEALLEKEYRRASLMFYPGVIFDNLTIALQVEDELVTDYILHEHQNFAFPLSEGQRLHEEDYLADDGIHHKRTFIELDGVTTGKKVVNVTNNTGKYHQIQISNNLIKPGSRARCNIAKTTEAGSFGNAGTVTISQTTSNAYIHVEWGVISDSVSTIEEVNQFLADLYNTGTPVILEIELNEEIVEGYTEAQKNVHDAIKKAKTYKNVTHMYSTNTIKPVMDVTYYKDLETINKNNAAEIAELRELVNTLSQAMLNQ